MAQVSKQDSEQMLRSRIRELEAQLAEIQTTWRERIGSGNPAGSKGDGWWVRMEKAITAREEKG